ncbi:MAG: short chain dehydrogenase, partial [Pseudomonadota bacterium]
MNINGSVALITGGGNGIGAAIAQYLSAKGANIVIVDRSEEQAQ